MEFDDLLPLGDLIGEQFDLDNLFGSDAFPEHSNTDRQAICEIENHLMADDQECQDLEPPKEFVESLLADVLVDSPSDVPTDKDSPDSNDSPKLQSHNNSTEEADDPISKKRRRQLRNRDAAVRSRERKKVYVKDLEMKSRYLEMECRRLGRLLQCCYAENQALRFSLQMSNTSGAPTAKQESAVLLMELLLLGSLLWFLGITCLLTLPIQLQTTLERLVLESDGKRSLENQAPGGQGRQMSEQSMFRTSVKGRRCRASRTRIKPYVFFRTVLV